MPLVMWTPIQEN